jgi:hypothetical protein
MIQMLDVVRNGIVHNDERESRRNSSPQYFVDIE